MRMRGSWLGVLGLLVAGCGGDLGAGDDDNGGADADPFAPDADPFAPDADPDQPDADPDEPDAGTTPTCNGSGEAAQPFGNHALPYAAGSIRPNNHSAAQLDDAVTSFYDTWKAAYLTDDCGGGRYVIETGHPDAKTVSEAHGYGMLVFAYMAGHDPQAKQIFDGMYEYYLDHQSATTPYLMAWSQNDSCNDANGADSATDGDLDIAYALLLADKQWGSGGTIDYHAAAVRVIAAIRAGDVSSTGQWILLGDWPEAGSTHYKATRSSDFMPGHLVSFAAATGDSGWTALLGDAYDMVDTLQTNFAPQTGLLPDFIVNPTTPAPAPSGFLEGAADGRYGYNACRDPWRLAVHFLTTGDGRARDAVAPMSDWIKDETGGNPAGIRPGYQLNGTPSGGNYVDMCFVAPFGVAAMASASHQTWLNTVWDFVDGAGPQGYYQDTVKLLSMIAMSGNWWAPEDAPCP